MAKWDQVTGFLGCLNAGNAGNAQHIPLFGGTGLNNCQRGRKHVNAPARHGDAMRASLGGHVHHMGLALGVKMGEGTHR